MVSTNKVRHYYANGHTRIGYYSVIPEIIGQLDRLFVLKGLSMNQADQFIKKLAQAYLDLNSRVDYFHSASANDKLEGIRVLEKNIAVFTNDFIKKMKADLSQHRMDFLSFNDAMEREKADLHKEQIFQLEKERDYYYLEAYKVFAEAKEFHERKEKIYLSAMSFKKADEIAGKLIKTIFVNRKNNTKKQGNEEKIFFGAATPKGAVNFIEELTSHLKRRYIIKGRSGSGKSHLMRRVGKEALSRGLNITYFLCGFDPTSVDMIVIEELGIAIIDGTSPHVIDPTRKSDKVIDMFELCIDPKVEETKMDEIIECDNNYKERMKKGTLYLEKARKVQIVIDEYIDDCFNQDKLQLLTDEMLKRIIESAN